MIDSFSVFWDKVGCRKRYWIPVLFFTISSFGFSIFNRTISIDDLASELYNGSSHTMIGGGRWGAELITKLVAIPRISPASDRLLATFFLVLAGILLASLLYSICRDYQDGENVEKYTVLSCCLITYPIIGEIWEYTGANYMSTGGMLLSIVVCYYLLGRKNARLIDVLLTGFVMSIPMSSYESGAAFYVTLVCAVLFYKYCIWGDRSRRIKYWKKAVFLALPVFVALGFRWLIGAILRWALNVPKRVVGGAAVIWGKDTIPNILRKFMFGTILNYGVNGLVYLPITIFLIAVFFLIGYIIYISISQKSIMVAVGGLLLILSVFLLGLIQGDYMAYRTAIPLSALTSFSFFCLAELFEERRRKLQRIVIVLVMYLVWIQSAFLNSELSLNNQRSENEMRIMNSIAQRILTVDTKKPVVFVGEYNMSEYFRVAKKDYTGKLSGKMYQRALEMFKKRYGDYYYTFFHLTEFPDSNINSAINWSINVDGMMEKYFSYLGYDIHVKDRSSDPEAVIRAQKIVEEQQMHSYDVMETDGFIIATLQLN